MLKVDCDENYVRACNIFSIFGLKCMNWNNND